MKKTKERQIRIPFNTNKIISILGPRRSGKSYLLYTLINQLVSRGIKKEKIIYINFEDERIIANTEDLQSIIEAYLELYTEESIQNIYFFFDEIQNILGREKFIRRIYDVGVKEIFITGSNAKLLSKEIATALRGRSLSFELLPLSFTEFLSFHGEKHNLNTTHGKAKIQVLQKEYLKWGGFPEIIHYDESLKIKTLQEYFDVMIYNDIIERYSIKDVGLLKQFVKQLLQTTTKEYSINKIGNILKSLGFAFNKNTLYNYIHYLDTICFSKSITKFDYSLSKQTLKKIYLFDTGYLNALSFSFSDNWGKLLENTVFIELRRRHSENIYFLKNGSETDFIVHEKEKNIFQVCYEINGNNREREIQGCFDAMKKFSLNQAVIITAEHEEIYVYEGHTITMIPFYKRAL